MTSAAAAASVAVPPSRRRGIILLAAAVGAGCIAAGTWLPWNSMWPLPGAVETAQIGVTAAVTTLWLIAALVAIDREQRGPLWVVLLSYVVLIQGTWSLQFLGDPLAFALGSTFQSLSTAVMVHALVAFPSGRLGTSFDRRLIGGVYAFTFLTDLVHGLTWNPSWEGWPYRNVLALLPSDAVSSVQGVVDVIAIPVIGLLVVAAVVRHWQGASPAARRVVAPVMVALPFLYVTNIVGYVGDNLGAQWLSDLGRHPILLACPAIVPIGYLLGTARSRLSRARVADLVVELGQGPGGLRDVLARALGDPALVVAYPGTQPDAWVDAEGRPLSLPATPASALTPITSQRGLLAVLVHDPAIEVETPGLVDAVGSAARLALENERLSAEVRAQLAEVRASRARIAAAADDERRRVERDLHDGAQQRLVALAMRLEQARASGEGASQLIDAATRELREAIAEVRALARGLHPSILSEAGLAAAVESLAERSPIPVEVSIPADRFPATVESTAYYVVAEALTNAARHAVATLVRVEARANDGVLHLSIADDGRGGASAQGGSGLRGLADRVAATGGSFEVTSMPGSGSTLRATIPLE